MFNCYANYEIYIYLPVLLLGIRDKSKAPVRKRIIKNNIAFRILPVIWSIEPNMIIPTMIPTFSVTS